MPIWGWVAAGSVVIAILAVIALAIWIYWFRRPRATQEPAREPTRTERRIRRVMELAATIIAPWKRAVEARNRIIESLKRQRDAYKDRLDEYVTALKGRDDIIRTLAEERDDLKAKLEAIETSEKPEDTPEEAEHKPPPPPSAAPGSEEAS